MSDACFDTIRLLLAHGADVDALDDDLDSPLHRSSYEGSVKAARILLEHGANVHLRNGNGKTASDIARTFGREEIVRMISENLERMQKM
jgi:ankyrin repeat protein